MPVVTAEDLILGMLARFQESLHATGDLAAAMLSGPELDDFAVFLDPYIAAELQLAREEGRLTEDSDSDDPTAALAFDTNDEMTVRPDLRLRLQDKRLVINKGVEGEWEADIGYVEVKEDGEWLITWDDGGGDLADEVDIFRALGEDL